MTIGDVQRQTSQRSYIPKKLSLMDGRSRSYVKRVLRRYSNLMHIYKGITPNGKMNHIMRYGLPKVDTNYVVKCYDELQTFIKLHRNDRSTTTTRKVADKLSKMVFQMKSNIRPTKAKMYGLHIPKTISVDPEVRNGERIHISLKEIGI